MRQSIVPSHPWGVHTYGGEKGECVLVAAGFVFLDAFLENHTPSLGHFCDKYDVRRSWRACAWLRQTGEHIEVIQRSCDAVKHPR
jgi:hypothetical protein